LALASGVAGALAGAKLGDLKRRLLFLLGALVVFRIGTHIPVPGIDPDQLKALFEGSQSGLLGMFNMFSGGAGAGYHALHLGVHHHAASDRGLAPARGAEERG